MDWIPLATRLGLHIALGYWLSLWALGPAPAGKFFYRLTGWTAAACAGLAGLLALSAGWPQDPWERTRVLCTMAAVLPAPWYVANKPRVRRAGLAAAVLCGGAALAARAFGPHGAGLMQLAGDLLSAAVAGGACFAMVFGHGYLTVPGLPVRHLLFINRFLSWSLAARLALSLAALAWAWPRLAAGTALLDLYGLLDLGVRYGVGLLFPLLFAAMVRSSLRWNNTQSATGILYALTILVWIGEAVALHLGERWSVPL